ncbi:iron chaperone [Peptoniphilus sp.]|jgi:uncharacterized protein YdhG (YjbR/CyaY superfamily)|uniref:iron chaperone n=1 Tax=Peptoniphilus sp. TaxID=1971214 RepID=UPI003D8A8A55
MWTCPNCGRQFKKQNQSHFCKEKPKTIKEYIDSFEGDKKEELYKVYNLLKEELECSKEKISWSMPTFYNNKNIIHFAAFKNHIGIYPGPEVIETLKEELACYKTSKGTIQIPYGKIDEKLIIKVAREAKKLEEGSK